MSDLETEVKFNLSNPQAYLSRVIALGEKWANPACMNATSALNWRIIH